MTYLEFLENQNTIYLRLSNDRTLTENGTVPNPNIKNTGGYLIALRHPSSLTDVIDEFSMKISNIIPSIIYNKSNIHTTISDYNIANDFVPDYAGILDKLWTSVKEIKNRGQILINYYRMISTKDSVIMAGIPNENFYNISQAIINNARSSGIELRFPWGAHITLSRFLEKKSPAELAEFFKLMESAPKIGEIKPEFIDVGYFTCIPTLLGAEFKFIRLEERFKL